MEIFRDIREQSELPWDLRRNINITNRITIVLSALTIIYLFILLFFFGWSITSPYIIALAIFLILIRILNQNGFYNSGRLLFTIVPPIIVLFLSLKAKLAYPASSDINYYDSRIILLAIIMSPGLVFSMHEKVKLWVAFGIGFLCIALFDPIHEQLGVGYYQRGFTGPSYFYINYLMVIGFFVITSGIITLKRIIEKSEKRQFQLQQNLETKNTELVAASENIAQQNKEIFSQREELQANQGKLEEAKRIVENYNEELKAKIEEKNKELIHANNELLRTNADLRQFSYTVSHNLRGPIARLLGLTQLLQIEKKEIDPEVREVLHLITNTAHDFDGIIKDLNKIIDIQKELHKINEKVSFEDEWRKVKSIVLREWEDKITLHVNFEAPYIFIIRPFLQSILFNLTSNALKYRSPMRPLELSVKSAIVESKIILTIADNGLGINLDTHGEKVFGLYNRFHTHTEGKGLGLYLVKTQVEAMNGNISVASKLNEGTTFTIAFKVPEKIDGQLCYRSEFGSIYYNATTNTVGIVWDKQVTSEGYRHLFSKCREMVQLYNTPTVISDMRKQGSISGEDQLWMVNAILRDSIRNGLRNVCGIYDPLQHNEAYRKKIEAVGKQEGITIKFFTTKRDAEAWIEKNIS